MFLAMQTSQESSQHQYITLHPVTMDSNDESMTMVNTDSLNISQSVLNSHGTSDINSCDVNKPRGLNENSQVKSIICISMIYLSCFCRPSPPTVKLV